MQYQTRISTSKTKSTRACARHGHAMTMGGLAVPEPPILAQILAYNSKCIQSRPVWQGDSVWNA